jgi:hypothetical protein
MKLSFSERDEFGNGRGVDISLLPAATPKQIVAIGKYYEKVGWQPSRPTKRALDAAARLMQSRLCPECDSEILPDEYCMMGHWCGTPVVPVVELGAKA